MNVRDVTEMQSGISYQHDTLFNAGEECESYYLYVGWGNDRYFRD